MSHAISLEDFKEEIKDMLSVCFECNVLSDGSQIYMIFPSGQTFCVKVGEDAAWSPQKRTYRRNAEERRKKKQPCRSFAGLPLFSAASPLLKFFGKNKKIKQKRLISAIECGTIIKQVGSLAQLGEHLPYKQRVGGSSPSISTNTVRIVDYAGIAQW